MGGGLIQLVTQGVQDTPLVVNPEITFFKAVYKTYTNFSMEHNKQNLGRVKFSQVISKNIDKLGDLLHDLNLHISVPYFNIKTTTVTSELLVQGYYINSIGINWENHNCLVLYSVADNNWYIVPQKLFELTEFTKNITFIKSEIIEPKLLPSFINYADLGSEMKYYSIASNEISSFIAIAQFNSNFWQKLWLDYVLNSDYETQMITLKSYNTKLNEIFRQEIFNNYWFNYPQASNPELYNFTFNSGVIGANGKEIQRNEVGRYYDIVSNNNQTTTPYKYDIDVTKDYTTLKGLDFQTWAQSSIQCNAGMIRVIYELIYAEPTLTFLFWKKYSVKFGNIPLSIIDSNGTDGEWKYRLNNYMDNIFRSVTLNNQIFDEFTSKYYSVYRTIDNAFSNLNLLTPLDIYIKLKTIMNRFYLVPNTQINFNDRFYSSYYPDSINATGLTLTNLVLADSYTYQINLTKSSYPNLYSNVKALDLTNEMNNLTPVDISHIYPIICQEYMNFIATSIYSNSEFLNWIVFWKNNIVVRLYLAYLDYYGLLSVNQELKDNNKTRNLTYYYGLFPSNSFNTNDFKNSFYSNFYKSSFIGYCPTTTSQLNILKANINVVKSQDLFKSTFTNNNTKFSNLKISQTKIIDITTSKYIIDNNNLYVRYNNWVDSNTNLYLTMGNQIITYDKFYLECVTNQSNDIDNGLYLVFKNFKVDGNTVYTISNNITIDSIRNIQIPIVTFDPTNKKVPYPSIEQREYDLLTKNSDGSIATNNIIDINTINLDILVQPFETVMYNVIYGSIMPPLATFTGTTAPANNINFVDVGTHLYCISWITSTNESNVSKYIRVDIPSYKINNVEQNYYHVALGNLPIPSNPNIIGIRFYRTKANDTAFYLLDTIYNITNVYDYLDDVPDSKLTNLLGSYDIQTNPNDSYCESKRVILKNDSFNKYKVIDNYTNEYITMPISNYSNILRIYLTIINTGVEIVSNNCQLTDSYYTPADHGYDYDYRYNYWMVATDPDTKILNLACVQKLVPDKKYVPFLDPPFQASAGSGTSIHYKISYYDTINGNESIASLSITANINSTLHDFSPVYSSDYNAYKIYRSDNNSTYYLVSIISSDLDNFTPPTILGDAFNNVRLYIDEPVKPPILSTSFTLVRTPIVNYAPNLYPWTSAPTDSLYMCSKKNSDLSDTLFTKPFIMIGTKNQNPEYRTYKATDNNKYSISITEETINYDSISISPISSVSSNLIKQTMVYTDITNSTTYTSVLFYSPDSGTISLSDKIKNLPPLPTLPDLPLTSTPLYYYTNKPTLELFQDLNTFYFYNIDQIVGFNSTIENTIIELDGYNITNIMPVAFNQFFSRNFQITSSANITQYVDNYYLLNLSDLSGAGSAIQVDEINEPVRIIYKTWAPHFDSLSLPPNWLNISKNIYWYNIADILTQKLNLVIMGNGDYVSLTNLIDTISNEYNELFNYFITQYNNNSFYGLSTKQVITNSKTISNVPNIINYSNDPYKNYTQGTLRLYQVDGLSTNIVLNTFGQKVKIYNNGNLVNVLSPVYTYYNAYNKLGNTLTDYLSNVDTFFVNHIKYVNSNIDWLNISTPLSYKENYDSYENIVGQVQDNYYNYSDINSVQLAFTPIDDFDTVNINGNIITDFDYNNNIITIPSDIYSVNQIENKPYNTEINKTNIYEFIPNRFNYLGLVKFDGSDFNFDDTLGTTYNTLTLDDLTSINIYYDNGYYYTSSDCINMEVLNPVFDSTPSFPIVIQSNKIYPYYNQNNLIQQIQSIKDDDYILLENHNTRVVMKRSQLQNSNIPPNNYKLWCLPQSLDLLPSINDYWTSGTISASTTLTITVSSGYVSNSFYLVSNSLSINTIIDGFVVYLGNQSTIDTGLLPSIGYFSGVNFNKTVYLYLINPDLFGKEYRQRIVSQNYHTTKNIDESNTIAEIGIFQPLWNMPYMEPNDDSSKIDLIKSIANYIIVPETNKIYPRSEFDNIDGNEFIYWTSNYATIKYCNNSSTLVKNDFDWTLTFGDYSSILYDGEIIIINTLYFIVTNIYDKSYTLKLLGTTDITSLHIGYYYTIGTIKNSTNRIFEPNGNMIFKYMAPLSYNTFYLDQTNQLKCGIPSSNTFILYYDNPYPIKLYSDGTYLYLQDDWINIKPLDIINYLGTFYKILAINQGKIVLNSPITTIGWIDVNLPYQPFKLQWINITNGIISNTTIENNNIIGIESSLNIQNLYWINNNTVTSFNNSTIPADGKYLAKIYKTDYKGLFENSMTIKNQFTYPISSDYPITLENINSYNNNIITLNYEPSFFNGLLNSFDFYLSQPVLINGVFGRLTNINTNSITIYYENNVPPTTFKPTYIILCPSIVTTSDFWTRTKFYYNNQIYPNIANNIINIIRFCLDSQTETLLFIQKYKNETISTLNSLQFNITYPTETNETNNNITPIPNTKNIYFYENRWLQPNETFLNLTPYTLEIGSYHLLYSDLSNIKYDTICLVKIIGQNKFLNCSDVPIKTGLISFGKLIDAWHNGDGTFSWGTQKILTGNRLQNVINNTVKLSKKYNISFKTIKYNESGLYQQEIRFLEEPVNTNLFNQVYLDAELTMPVNIEYEDTVPAYYIYLDSFKSNIHVIYTLQENWIVSSNNSNKTLSQPNLQDTTLEKYIDPITINTKKGYMMSLLNLTQTASSNKAQIYGYTPNTLLNYSKYYQFLENVASYSIGTDYNKVKEIDIQTRILKTTYTLSPPNDQSVGLYVLTNTGTFSNQVGVPTTGLNNLKLFTDYTITNPIPDYDYLFNSGTLLKLKLINETNISESYIYNKVKKWDWYSLLNGLNNDADLDSLVNNYYALEYDNGDVIPITTLIPDVYAYMTKDETTMLSEFLTAVNENSNSLKNYIYINKTLEPALFNQIPNWLSNCEFFFNPTKYINDWLNAFYNYDQSINTITFNGTNLIFNNNPNPTLNLFGEIASYITNEYTYDSDNNIVSRSKPSDLISDQINKWLSNPSTTGNYGVSIHKVLRYLNDLGILFSKTYNEWENSNMAEFDYMTSLKFMLDKINADMNSNIKYDWILNLTQSQEIASNPFRNINTAYSSTNYLEALEIDDVNIETDTDNLIESNSTDLVEYSTSIHIKDTVITKLSNSANIPYSIEFNENVIYNGCTYSIEMADKTKIDNENIIINDAQLYTSKMTFYLNNDLDANAFPIVYQNIGYSIKNIETKGMYYELIFNDMDINNIDNLWWNDLMVEISNMIMSGNNAYIYVHIEGTPKENDMFQIKNYVGIKSITIDTDNNIQHLTFYSNYFKYTDTTFIQFDDNTRYPLIQDYDYTYYIENTNIITNYNPIIITCISLSSVGDVTNDGLPTYMYKIGINEQFGPFQSIPYQPSANYNFSQAILPADFAITNNSKNIKAIQVQSIDSSNIYFYTNEILDNSYTKMNYTNRLSHVNINGIQGITPQQEFLYKVNKIIPKCDNTSILLLDTPYNPLISINNSIYFNQENGSTLFTFNTNYNSNIGDYKWAQKNEWNITDYNYSSGILSFTAPSSFVFDTSSNYSYYINNVLVNSNQIIFQSNVLYITTIDPAGAFNFNQYYISNKVGEIITPKSNQSMLIELLNPTQFSSNLKFYTTYFNDKAETFNKYLYTFSKNNSPTPLTGQFNGNYTSSNNDIVLIKNGVEWTGKIIDSIDTDYLLISLEEEIDKTGNWYMYKDNIKSPIYNLSYYSNSYNFGDYYKQEDLNSIYIFGEPTTNNYINCNNATIINPKNRLYLASYFDYKMTNLYEPNIAIQLEDMKQVVSANTTNQTQIIVPEFKDISKMFKNIKIYFGDQLIEQLNPDTYALDYWLYMDANRKKQAEKLIKIYDDGENYNWYFPIRFWFCMNSGLALPTLAMTNTNIRVEFELEDINNFIKNMPTKPNNSNIIYWNYEFDKLPTARLDLISDFILLDNAERRLFGTYSHEYVIERYRIYHNYFITNSTQLIPTYRNFRGLVKDLHMISKPINYPDLTYIPNKTPMYDTRYARYITALGYYNIFILTNSYTSTEQYTYSQDINIIGQIKSGINSFNSGLTDGLYYELLQSIYDFFSTWEIWTTDLFQYLGYFAVYYYNNIIENYNKINYLMSMYLKYIYSPKVHIEEVSPVSSMKIQIDGTDLFSSQSSNYWNGVVPTMKFKNYVPQGYYSWTWSLNPLELQPSGSLNFSNFENVIIQVESDSSITPTNPYILNTIIKEYNIIRIMGGIGALGFVN